MAKRARSSACSPPGTRSRRRGRSRRRRSRRCKRAPRSASFAVLGVENVGPQVGAELRQQGLLAVVGVAGRHAASTSGSASSCASASARSMATLHDVLITLGLFACFGYEFNLTTIAAFLTLIGYSVNDTVVIFDRVRENLRKSRAAGPADDVLNRQHQPDAVAHAADRRHDDPGRRSCSAVLGGEVISGFAFVMIVGIIVGTYSSIYIASPFALLWEDGSVPAAGSAAARAPRAPAKRDHRPLRAALEVDARPRHVAGASPELPCPTMPRAPAGAPRPPPAPPDPRRDRRACSGTSSRPPTQRPHGGPRAPARAPTSSRPRCTRGQLRRSGEPYLTHPPASPRCSPT